MWNVKNDPKLDDGKNYKKLAIIIIECDQWKYMVLCLCILSPTDKSTLVLSLLRLWLYYPR